MSISISISIRSKIVIRVGTSINVTIRNTGSSLSNVHSISISIYSNNLLVLVLASIIL